MTTPYALQLVVSEYLKTGESFRSVARDVGVSRQAVARIARYGPDEVLRRPRVNVEVITWAVAAFFDGAPEDWIRRELCLTSVQFDQMTCPPIGLPAVRCPLCRMLVSGLCLACFLERRATRPQPTK